MDCRVCERLVLGFKYVEYLKGWYWVCSGLWIIRCTGTRFVRDCRVYGGLVPGL